MNHVNVENNAQKGTATKSNKQTKTPKLHRPHYPRPHSHLFFSSTGQILRGKRHFQRYHNSLYLKALLPLNEEELAEDYSAVAPQYESSFTRIHTNNHHRMLWEEFDQLSEDQQEDLLKIRRSKRCHRGKSKYHDDEKPSTSLIECINPRIMRILLEHKHTALDFIESIEKELYEYFSDDPLVIVIFLNLTSFHRLLVHGVCQYNSYTSITYHIDDKSSYLMIGCDELCQPPVMLFKMLQKTF